MNTFEWKELQNLTAKIELDQDRLRDAKARRDVGRLQRLEEELARNEKRRTELLAYLSTNLVNAPAPPGRAAGKKAAPVDAQPETAPADAEPETARVDAEPDTGLATVEQEGATAAEPIAEAVEESSELMVPEPAAAAAEPEPIAAVEAPEAETAADEPTAEAAAEEEAAADEPTAEAAGVKEAAEDEVTAEEVAAPDAAKEEAAAVAPSATGASGAPATEVAAKTAIPAPAGGAGAAWNGLSVADINRARSALALRRAEILARQAEELRALDVDRGQIVALDLAIDNFTKKFKLGDNGASPSAAAEQDVRQGKPAGKVA